VKNTARPVPIKEFAPGFAAAHPETQAQLSSACLVVHPSVSRIILHGSRGLAGGYRPDSDIDLSLIVDPPPGEDVDAKLKTVTETTLRHWRAPVEVDLAVIFDIGNCALRCFDRTAWDPQLCQRGGVDCFGLYKIQKGFHGRVSGAGIQVRLMYPCLKIWQG
jgi:predicted nucleotidyltransferase